jgi:hypothetical protein
MGACRSARPASIGGHWGLRHGLTDYCSCLPVGWAMPLAAFAVVARTISIPAPVRMKRTLRTEEGGCTFADDEVHAGGWTTKHGSAVPGTVTLAVLFGKAHRNVPVVFTKPSDPIRRRLRAIIDLLRLICSSFSTTTRWRLHSIGEAGLLIVPAPSRTSFPSRVTNSKTGPHSDS